MIESIKNIISGKKASKTKGYSGLSDFLTRAPEEKKKEVFYKAARIANEDQMRIYKEGGLKTN